MEATGDRTATFSSPRAPQVQNGGKKKKEKGPRTFDMSKYRQRKIAILLQYSGQQYHGFASQAEGSSSEETIEKHLFIALTKLRLIVDRKSCEYTRCGRTDKGTEESWISPYPSIQVSINQYIHDSSMNSFVC